MAALSATHASETRPADITDPGNRNHQPSIEQTAAMAEERSIQFLKGRETVLIISPQPWQGFQVSKHHYALQLAELGNQVYFLDPPYSQGRVGKISLNAVHKNLITIQYRPFFPYWLKFHGRRVFDQLMKIQTARILKRLEHQPTVVWDFDNTQIFCDLRWFRNAFRIFHPVDQLGQGKTGTKNAHCLFSVAEIIASRFSEADRTCHVIPHGLGREHASYGQQRLKKIELGPVTHPRASLKFGYVGNLAAGALDRETLLEIALQNPGIEFEFFGPYHGLESDVVFQSWLDRLRRLPNCRLRGLSTPSKILSEADEIDGWLLCYDATKDINGGANSHKILEYLATGKVTITSHLDAYVGSSLIQMTNTKSNEELPRLFQACAKACHEWNTVDRQQERIRFALEHSYSSHLSTIQRLCNASHEQRENIVP